MWKIFFIVVVCIHAWGMRLPSSLIKGPVISNEGFELNPSQTPWVRVSQEHSKVEKLEALFKLKDKNTTSSAIMSVRVDKEGEFNSLQEYANKWLKSYTQFGLEILGHQYFKNNQDEKGLVIDLKNSSSNKKFRQVIFFRDSKAVIMTCTDRTESFAKTLKDCNSLIQSFSWIERNPIRNVLDTTTKIN